MGDLTAADFGAFFRDVHGHAPFPWQQRLCRRVLDGGWPRLLQLPTASGKTAVMDVAVFALAAGAPGARRRIAFVVDRRVVVDEASQRARRIAAALASASGGAAGTVARALRSLSGSEVPLVTATLRGGILRNDAWARTPAQPVLVCSTVDQVGSRLLFRGYGSGSSRSWPIHAGLLGVDTLMIVDEAHCARPFCETALAIAERYGRWAEVSVGKPLTLMRMSATVGEAVDFELGADDRATPALRKRLAAAKPARLEAVSPKKGEGSRAALARRVVEIAMELAGETPRVVGVIVNRVSTAREVFASLPLPEARKLLLTGRVRPWERDRLLEAWEAAISAEPDRSAPAESLVVVATQCVEVGANLDFDALVTECASLDALRQRFGRVNRLGRTATAPAAIVADASQLDEKADEDPVYGGALRRTWAWLSSVAATDGGPSVDMGVDAMEGALPVDEELATLCTPARHAPILLPAHLDLLVQTSPEPAVSPEPGLFLHGPATGADDVTVIWRADLDQDDPGAWIDLLAAVPPLAGEGCAVPFVEARDWLAQRGAPASADADVPASAAEEEPPAGGARRALRWRGLDDSDLVDGDGLRPGDTIVVPSVYGGCDRYGWNAGDPTPVADLGDAVGARARVRPDLRVDEAVVRTWLSPETDPEGVATTAVGALRQWSPESEEIEPAELLATIAGCSGLPAWVRDLCGSLARDGRRRLLRVGGQGHRHDGVDRSRLVIVGSRPVRGGADESETDFTGTDDRSALTVKVTLDRHSAGVRRWAEQFAQACHLPDATAGDVALAAWLHDVGKADPRFQVWLCRGDEVAAAMEPEPLAKSDFNPRQRADLRRARERAGYPTGGRHEFQSLALIEASQGLLSGAGDADLVRHLVSSHHGYGRPLAPVVEDPAPVNVALVHGGIDLSAGSDHGLHRLDSGVAGRFWALVRRYGWWGLAFLEAIVRLADHRRSEEEQLGGGEP